MPQMITSLSQEMHFTYSQEELKELAAQILKQAMESGASDCDVDISEGFGLSVTVRCGNVETIERNRDKGIGITIYLGQQRGYASTSDFSSKALCKTVEAALNIARFTAIDDCAGLPEKHLLANSKKAFTDLSLYHPWLLTTDEAVLFAKRCEQAAFAVDSQITNSEGATVSTQESHFISANSLGFMGGYPASRHFLSCSVIAGKDEYMQRDDWYSNVRNVLRMSPPEAIGDYAARRALARLGARKIKTCKAPVIFEAPVAASLIGHFVRAVSGGNLYRKSSFLMNSLGQKVFSENVNISERPHLLEGISSSAFDSDGVETRDREVVIDGVLQGYFLGVYTARKLGLQTTGNAGGSHNLLVQSGNCDLPQLIKKMNRGLLVTEFLGHGVNYVNGDYSRGAAGFWVENGEIVFPVQEITIAGNLREMFLSILDTGNDVVTRGAKQTGSILIENMQIAGD